MQLVLISIFLFPLLTPRTDARDDLLTPQFWRDGIVPYIIDRSLQDHVPLIKKAMGEIHSSTQECIVFVERKRDKPDYIRLIRGRNCSSDIGRQGGEQVLSFSTGCIESKARIQHQLLHVLGFFHEIARPDRDNFIWISRKNIKDEYQPEFDIQPNMPTYDLPYDYDSVIHHSLDGFMKKAEPDFPTLISRRDFGLVTLPDKMSALDFQRILRTYGCPENNTDFEVVREETHVDLEDARKKTKTLLRDDVSSRTRTRITESIQPQRLYQEKERDPEYYDHYVTVFPNWFPKWFLRFIRV